MLNTLRAHRQAEAAPSYDALLVESVVLSYVLTECPEGISVWALAAHFNVEFDQGEGSMDVEVAARELVRSRLLQMRRGMLVPDQAGNW